MDMGLRIHGGYTRSILRSLSVCMLTTIMILGEIKYEIFPGLRGTGTGKKIKSFERLIFEECGK